MGRPGALGASRATSPDTPARWRRRASTSMQVMNKATETAIWVWPCPRTCQARRIQVGMAVSWSAQPDQPTVAL